MFCIEQKKQALLDEIYTRRSVRQYTDRPVKRDLLVEIINAGTWAPSGLNNQPWRFVIIQEGEVRLALAKLTQSQKTIESASACIAVFIDKEAMYHEMKDFLAMGACIQNMILAAHVLGLGAVWLGEILKNTDKVNSLLELPETLLLTAVVAVGYPFGQKRTSSRRDVSEILLKEY